MQTPRRLLARTADRLDLPADLVADLGRVEMEGFCRLTVENHRGISQFEDRELKLELPEGRLVICGTGLTIRTMTAQRLELSGRIESLTLEEDTN